MNREETIPWTEENGRGFDTGRLTQAKIWPVVFAFSICLLMSLSIMMIHSATVLDKGSSLFWQQLIWISAGLVTAIIVAFLPMKYLRKYAAWGMVAILIPLAYLALAYVTSKLIPGSLSYFPCVPSIKGAVRWFKFPCPVLGSIQLQPSEFAKFFLLIYLSSYYGGLARERCKTFRYGVLVPSVLSGAVCFLVLMGKDLSTTVVIGTTCFGLMYLAGVRLKYLLCIVVIGMALGTVAILSSPERISRVTSYKNPELDKDDDAYQLWRSQLALGSGGWFGRGYSQGVLKTYLPEQHTDFIIAVIGEEMGFVTVLAVLLLYGLLLLSSSMIGVQCKERPDMLLCIGIGLMLSLQALINIAVVSGWCPTTGVTAPFLSYGGSSMVMTLALAGLVINAAIRNMRDAWNDLLNSKCYLTTKAL